MQPGSEHVRVAQRRACQAQELPLSDRKVGAALVDAVVEAALQGVHGALHLDELEDACGFQVATPKR